jgi:hypothetical protein
VIHSFFVPQARTKQDALPGREIPVWFNITQPGVYEIPCAELCGFGHSGMKGQLTVYSDADYEKWLKEQWPPAGAAPAEGAQAPAEGGETPPPAEGAAPAEGAEPGHGGEGDGSGAPPPSEGHGGTASNPTTYICRRPRRHRRRQRVRPLMPRLIAEPNEDRPNGHGDHG